jgi:uncharacterized membrane protein (TIGR01666 family)
MDYLRQYKSFVNSHYLSEGLRITAGLTLPAVLLGYFHYQATGIIVSLGAASVMIVDNAGPIRDRRSAMLVCDMVIFLVAILTGLVSHSPLALGALIFLICFVFSMFTVYGTRVGSIGLAAMFVMVLNIGNNFHGAQIMSNAFFVLCGGLWYTGLSLLLYSFRPFKLAQQALGECLQATADFMRLKASFYKKQESYEKNYQLVLDKQVSVHQIQDLVRDLLFESRDLVKETTRNGRILVMIFLDAMDLFELVMSSHQDYEELHHLFDKSNILQKYQEAIVGLANKLDDIGIAVKSGRPLPEKSTAENLIRELNGQFDRFRDESRTADNVEGFIALRHILENLQDIDDRLNILENYTSGDPQVSSEQMQQAEYEKFATARDQNLNLKIIGDNLSFESNIFRHSLRVSLATFAGYIVSRFFPLGHGYWILLTIIVILKPAYSLTKKRNHDRLLGTLAGAGIGLVILYFVKDKDFLFACMIALMIGAYSFMRSRYLVFVVLMTPFILLLFYLLNPNNISTVVLDRIMDTAIGSAIAFLANILIAPAWEHEQFRDYLLKMSKANFQYFRSVAGSFIGATYESKQYKLARKEAFVALANLSDGFNRMLSEPNSKQKNIAFLHPFVVSQHMLTSHIASLSTYVEPLASEFKSENLQPVVETISLRLSHVTDLLEQKTDAPQQANRKEGLRNLNDKVSDLLDQRKRELNSGVTDSPVRRKLSKLKSVADQFNFISKIAIDLEKLCQGLNAG